MNTVLLFQSLDKDDLEARSVQFNILDCPIMLEGFRFHLKIFRTSDEASVLRCYRDSLDNIMISCEVSSRTIRELVKQGNLMENSVHFYELPEQKWESKV